LRRIKGWRKRKKDVRNPRVKKRKKYEEKKKKKLSSIRAVYKGGEGRGGYGGEKTGIKTGLVKSIKL
jgi:U3 small nucleolar RNA-associated protein 3